MSQRLRTVVAGFAALCLLNLAAPGASAETFTPGTPAAGHGLVAAANPYAAQAGLEVLKRGGSAVDAAVAIQATLGLVEPQSSGVGGGAFLLVYDAKTRKVTSFNGRETAPKSAGADLWLDETGKPLPFPRAVVSGRATGVPGAIGALAMAHHEFGKLAWRDLFESPAQLAEKGFVVSPRLANDFKNGRFPELAAPDVQAYFKKPDGRWVEAGDVLKNPAYAATLRSIAARGAGVLYEGEIAQAILAKTHQAPLPGGLTEADLKAYHPIESSALCRPWKVYVVCVPPPPSSGVGLLEQLALLSHTDIDKRGPADPQAWEEFAESSRVMYADRDRYVGDPAFVGVPVQGLLDPAYDAQRAALIGPHASPTPPPPGNPPGAAPRSKDATAEPGGTTHFVIVDKWGNVVSMTTTVESIFGTGRMVGGFFLNNQLTDFSFVPKDAQGSPVANAPGPGKRPRSTMSPTIVLDRDGRFVAAIGSPGGNQILEYDAKALVGMFDWNLPVQQAIALPNLIARGSVITGETEKFPPGTLEGLRALGVEVQPGGGEESGLHGVRIRDGRFDAGADPRREGVVLTD